MDTNQLEAALAKLSPLHRTLVAIVCAERAADLHAHVTGSETDVLRSAVTFAWEYIHKSHEAPERRVMHLRQFLSDHAPHSDEGDNVATFACASADAALASLHDDGACKHAVFSLLDAVENAAGDNEGAKRSVAAEYTCLQELCNTTSLIDLAYRDSLLQFISIPPSFTDSASVPTVPGFAPGSRVFGKDERFELCIGDKATRAIKRPVAVGPTLKAMQNYAANNMLTSLQSDEILIAIDGHTIAEFGVVQDDGIVWSDWQPVAVKDT